MPSFAVETAHHRYEAVVERGILRRFPDFLPPRHGRVFVVTEPGIWDLHGGRLCGVEKDVLFFAGGEERKRLAAVEALAEQMTERGADRTSLVVAFGGGIVNDLAGFLAAIYMRGVPVIQVPTTLLAQVDAAVGGKTGANLAAGKNLIGAFHQPRAVLIDPEVLETLPEREYRAGLYEVLKCGVIRDPGLFALLEERTGEILARRPHLLDEAIAAAVRIKCEVVTADERESDLRRILNFGHTLGHALEAATQYRRFLHGEAVAFGMDAASRLAELTGDLDPAAGGRIRAAIRAFGPIPPLEGVGARQLAARTLHDKKTVQGSVHWVLPERVGSVRIRSGVPEKLVVQAAEAALAG
jgi:3-dehydroquinate synthase